MERKELKEMFVKLLQSISNKDDIKICLGIAIEECDLPFYLGYYEDND